MTGKDWLRRNIITESRAMYAKNNQDICCTENWVPLIISPKYCRESNLWTLEN